MRRYVIVAAVVGFLGGLLFPNGGEGGTTGYLFEAWYNISSGSSGQSPVLNCLWHSNCAVQPPLPGIGLDWDDTDTLNVYFRGGFKRSGPAGNHLHTHAYTYPNPRCYEFAVDVHEDHLEEVHGQNTPRWGMHYTHATIKPLMGSFLIYSVSTGYGWYNSFHVGSMVTQEKQNCPWTGTHVHDELWVGPYPIGLPGYQPREGFFVEGTPYQNNTHWTRYTAWGEGGYQP